MKILVCVSKTPDTTAKIAFTPDGTEYNGAGETFIMNPYDEWYALVRALELQETLGGSVTLINVGGSDNDAIIRKGLALGAQSAVRIDANPKSALNVARLIADHARGKDYDIIFCGKETIDYSGAEVGGMVAELLELPFLSFASKLDMNGNVATIACDIEGGKEVVEVQTPFVVSAAKGMAEQRIANMRGIMSAKTKTIEVIKPASLDAEISLPIHYELPPKKSDVKMIAPDDMEELVRLLHEEAKVI